MVSSRAFACPQCAHPFDSLAAAPPTPPPATEAAATTTVEAPAAPQTGGTAIPADATAMPAVNEWLGDMRKARELPARSKTCKQCDADVTFDSFRRKIGEGYLCADCIYEEEERRESRRVFFSRVMMGIGVMILLGMVAIVGLQLAPVLFAPHSSRVK
jgi:hypothetical protein